MANCYDISNRWLRNSNMAIGKTFNKLTYQKDGIKYMVLSFFA